MDDWEARKMISPKHVFLLGACTLAVLGLTGCTVAVRVLPPPPLPPGIGGIPARPNLTITNFSLDVQPAGGVVASGTIRNIGQGDDRLTTQLAIFRIDDKGVLELLETQSIPP